MNSKVVIIVILAIIVVVPLIPNLTDRRAHNRVVQSARIETIPSQSTTTLQTKNTNCKIVNALQDSNCTPGAVFPNVTREEICVPGYSRSVRHVPVEIKKLVYDEYRIMSHIPGEYEVDHLVSLELGGSNDIVNLWPEPAEPRPGYHEKDRFENYLHSQVCNGMISLQEAQKEISTNWLKYWQVSGQP